MFLGCGRNEKRHAIEHYQTSHKVNTREISIILTNFQDESNDLHCFMLNTTSFSCWCYECDEDIYPVDFENLIANRCPNETESPKTAISGYSRPAGPGT
jgi:hypothetical protein